MPIPDIVAHRQGALLLVEVDTAISKAAASLTRYRAAERDIMATFAERNALPPAEELLLGFCRTGLLRDFSTYVSGARKQAPEVDLIAAFEVPRKPLVDLRPVSRTLEDEDVLPLSRTPRSGGSPRA